ncbi:tRNA methyltransferase non-catalytic subunit [Acrasis kona]|uniref:tRNA methyltransferase non-catalytic subunit n=1 Tax=Acrasis kona TaxID=1008807 RepID=A0AAW2ZAX3_9EUKA
MSIADTLPQCALHTHLSTEYCAVAFGEQTKVFNSKSGDCVFHHTNTSQKQNAEENPNIGFIDLNGSSLVIAGNNKKVFLFDFLTQKLKATYVHTRKVRINVAINYNNFQLTGLFFTQDGKEVWLADKNGDAYSLDTSAITGDDTFVYTSATLRLGHISVITDMLQTSDQKYVITSDRDEKIRVSQYPECYIIHTYLLGNKEAITSVKQIDQDHIISSSLDRVLSIWSHKKEEDQLVCKYQLEDTSLIPMKMSCAQNGSLHLIAVAIEQKPQIQIFSFDGTSIKPFQVLDLPAAAFDVKLTSTFELWALTSQKESFVVYSLQENQFKPSSVHNSSVQTINALISLGVDPNNKQMYKSSIYHKRVREEKEEEEDEDKPKLGKRARKTLAKKANAAKVG